MRKFVLFVLAMILLPLIKAQDKKNVSEIGIIATDFNHSGLVFKVGTESALWRFAILDLSGVKSDTKDNPDNTTITYSGASKTFNIEARFGREYRHNILKRVDLIFGGDLSFLYASSQSSRIIYPYGYSSYSLTISYKRYVPGINLVTGLNYRFDGPFTLGLEWLPYLKIPFENNYVDDSELQSTNSGLSYGIFNIPLQISLTIRLK